MYIEIHVSCTNYVRTLKQDKVCFGQGFKNFYFKEKKNREREYLCTRCWCSGNSRTETPPMFNGKVDGC